MKRISFLFCFCVLAAVFTVSPAAYAQEFFPLDHELDLYCVYDPSNTGLAIYKRKTTEVQYVGFDEQRVKVEKLGKAMQKRIKTLTRAKADGTIDLTERISFKKLFKKITGGGYKADNDIRIAKFNSLIKKAKQKLNHYLSLLEEIERCRNRNLDTVTASGLTIQPVIGTFTHRGHNATYWISGVAAVTTLTKSAAKKGSGYLCVANKKSIRESQWIFETLLCRPFIDWQQNGSAPIPLQHFPTDCRQTSAGLTPLQAVAWLRHPAVSVGISSAPPSASRIAAMNRVADEFRKDAYRGRPYLKKRGC